ncbi:MAG TPA: FkbM family methyltransferase [Pyrinomonadaceae bacterium]|nr:FkbM family methyltransferase [Pyrinomonadaceae bacterium]
MATDTPIGWRAGDKELTVSVAVQKAQTLNKAYRQYGARGVLDMLAQKVKSTWRRGEVWQLGRFVGMSTDIVRLDGCKFTIAKDQMPSNVIDLLLSDLYEEPERAAVKAFVNPELPVVELGACIGVVSCITNRRLRNPQDQVVVEANPALLPVLKQNRERNGCHFKIVNAAVSYGSPTIKFNVDNNILASSVDNGETGGVVVSTTTLERLLDEHGFKRATLSCDIEGAELQLVEHELKTLSERISTIIMELHDRLVGEAPTRQMLGTLERAGFTIVSREGDVVVLQRLSA